MLRTFMCGHGSWSADHGFFQLPPKIEVEFVINHAKICSTHDMFAICEGSWDKPSDRIIREFMACPNMRWTADDHWKKTTCEQRIKSNQIGPCQLGWPNNSEILDDKLSMTLKDWIARKRCALQSKIRKFGKVRLVWSCCTHVLGLKSSSFGKRIGVNNWQGDYIIYNENADPASDRQINGTAIEV